MQLKVGVRTVGIDQVNNTSGKVKDKVVVVVALNVARLGHNQMCLHLSIPAMIRENRQLVTDEPVELEK